MYSAGTGSVLITELAIIEMVVPISQSIPVLTDKDRVLLAEKMTAETAYNP